MTSVHTRPEVLFLRSFEFDEHNMDSGFERNLHTLIRLIGRPGALADNSVTGKQPQDVINRIAVRNEEWQTEILEMMKVCSIIVMQVALSEGLFWELASIKNHMYPKKLLLIVFGRMEAETPEIYEKFRWKVYTSFQLMLPPRLSDGDMLLFDNSWKAKKLPRFNISPMNRRSIVNMFLTLLPVLRQHGARFGFRVPLAIVTRAALEWLILVIAVSLFIFYIVNPVTYLAILLYGVPFFLWRIGRSLWRVGRSYLKRRRRR